MTLDSIAPKSTTPDPEITPPQAGSRSIRWEFLALGLVAAVGIGAWQGVQLWQEAVAPVGGAGLIRVEIPAGAGSTQIGQILYQAGGIRSIWAWRLWMRIPARHWILQAGTYDLDPHRSMIEIATQLQQGATVQETYTILEGWRIQQMAQALAARGWFSAETFEQVAEQIRPQVDWIPPEAPSLEGYLFPDTYRIPIEMAGKSDEQRAEQVIAQMLNQFAITALPLYHQNQASDNPSPLTLHEWVTLGSIIEKEAVVAEERRLIAGVFVNRLEQGIPLGADPTVEYGLNIRQTPDRRLTYAEVRTPHPYNTYINVGLPPGAIASVGLASLVAALDPEATDLLYFVARYDGSHVFSRTLAEHEAAQQQIIQDRANVSNREGSP